MCRTGCGSSCRCQFLKRTSTTFPVADYDSQTIAAQPRASEVTIEEIEQALMAIASQTPLLQPHARPIALDGTWNAPTDSLGGLYQRLPARESKWLTRLILKSYSPVIVPEHLVYMSYHPFLPDLLEVEPDFSAALFVLRGMNIPALVHREYASLVEMPRESVSCQTSD